MTSSIFLLHDLKAAGATDYFALPVKSSFGTNYMVTYVTDRISGFTAQEISDLKRVTRRLPLLADLRNHRRIASNILNAYLGPKTGPKVLAGQIRRGAGEEITAVLWSSICAVSPNVPIASPAAKSSLWTGRRGSREFFIFFEHNDDVVIDG